LPCQSTGWIDIRKYVSVHDRGNLLNLRIEEGQHPGSLADGTGRTLD